MIAADLYTRNDPAQQDGAHTGPAIPYNSIPPSAPLHQPQPEHPHPHWGGTPGPAIHAAECSPAGRSGHTEIGPDSHAGTSSINLIQQHHQPMPNSDPGLAHPSSAAKASPSTETPASGADDSPSAHPTHQLAPGSTAGNISDLKPEMATIFHDPALDEDAPHEEDDEGSDAESPFMTLPMATGDSCQGGTTDPTDFPDHSARHSWSHPQPSDHAESGQKPERIPPAPGASSGSKRKRNSDPDGAAKPSARRDSGRPKQPPRVKTAEQLAAEALIEQQNPHASKNELRSLKLRALHAVRIAERELNMPAAEKQRRLRLREYVRQKRAEDRSAKAQGASTAGAAVSPPGQKSHSPSSAPIKNEGHLPDHQETQATDVQNPLAAPPSQPDPNPPIPSPANGSSHQVSPLDPLSTPNGHGPEAAQKPKKRAQKGSGRKSAPRGKAAPVSPLEAEIKMQHPHATPTQLKSLKLRALHAERIAEREQHMSEKEKTRRAKLRQYMRKRRDEERMGKGLERTELSSPPVEVNPALDPALEYQGSLDPSVGIHGDGQAPPHAGGMPALPAAPLVPEGMNAADRLAAFSMMELTNNYQHQFGQQPAAPANHHLHPLFQMPLGQQSSSTAYDCAIQTGYAPAPAQWAHIAPPDSRLLANELAQKALHAALEEAVYMKPHPYQHHLQQQQQQHPDPLGEHHAHYSAHPQTLEAGGLGRLANEEMYGEVERAQQSAGSSSSHHHLC